MGLALLGSPEDMMGAARYVPIKHSEQRATTTGKKKKKRVVISVVCVHVIVRTLFKIYVGFLRQMWTHKKRP